ncbi:hypothetical protein Bca101_067458 [Brassica carinata]
MKDWIYMTINQGMMLIKDMVKRSGFTDDIGNGPEKLGSEGGDVHAYDEFKLGEAVDVDEEKEEHHDDLHDRCKLKEFKIFVGSLEEGTTEDV